jgi:hypothetical protein
MSNVAPARLRATHPSIQNHVINYRTADKTERRRLRTEVLEACRDPVEDILRTMVPEARLEEGLQVGLVGVLVAIGNYDADKGPFDEFAEAYALQEIRTWLDKVMRIQGACREQS